MATQLKDLASIEAIIKEMTLEEKVACITGDSSFGSRQMEKYGIPKALMIDGGTGINSSHRCWEDVFTEHAKEREAACCPLDDEDFTGRMGGLEYVLNNPELLEKRRAQMKKATDEKQPYGCYPPGIFLGATWNPQVIAACGHALGKEANCQGVDVLLGTPNVNIHRDPLNGRLFEGYSEDPCLTATLAPHFVKAIQAEGIVANAKHYAANNQETDRMGVNEMIPERALREIYLPGFRACVEAGCKTVMSAYNKINGIPCAQNRWLLHDVLRKEWGFDGFVMTDWSAAYDQVEACAAGNDLVMPGPRQLSPVINAVKNGTLKEELLDECVRNFLKVVLEMPVMQGRKTQFDMQEGIRAAYDAAKEGIVLLKNDDVLPLKPNAKPAFYGKRSKLMMDSGAGSAAVLTSLTTSVYPCMAEALGEENVTFEEVTDDTTVVIVTVGANGQEGADRQHMRMEPEDRETLDQAIAAAEGKNIPLVVLINSCGPIQIADWEEKADAILCLFIPGMQGGQATADILLGKVNPSGKLPLTFPKEYKDCPTYGNFPGYNSEVWYGEGIYVGYRHYDRKGIDVMYPFGYGLSYTTFDITDASVQNCVDVDKENVQVRIRVKNTGSMAGSEVIQLYVHDVISTLEKPVKELKAFQKVWLEPGEEKQITLKLKKEDFASYDTRLGCFATEPGEFILMIGNSSQNIVKQLPVQILCENPYGLGPQTDIVKVVSHTAAVEIIWKVAEVKLKETAGSYIIFQPWTPFSQVWRECIVPAIHADTETAARLEQRIYEQWKNL